VTVSAVVYSEAGIEEHEDLAAARAAEGTS
jgi:hypothetical protein